MADYALPRDTLDAFKAFRQCRNPGLLFDRFTPDLSRSGRGDQAKREALLAVSRCEPPEALLAAFRDRWRAAAAGLDAQVFQARADWRVVVGLGRKGPLEVGFAFHRLYGFPLIPGSGLKGLARAFALLVEGLDPRDPRVVAVFGREPEEGKSQALAAAGGALFLDAIPAGSPELELDIVNPHFPDYYRGGGEPPTAWQSPIPVAFLAVSAGTPFLFAVGPRGQAGSDLRDLAARWLKGGLSRLGAGAKTAAGYGYFVVEEGRPTLPDGNRAELPGAILQPGPAAEVPLVWRRGTVREFRSDKGWGILIDEESGRQVRFEKTAVEDRGWTPGKKAPVEYAVVEQGGRDVVVKLHKAVR